MRKAILGVLLIFVTGPLTAQEQGPPAREALRRQVLERFMRNFIEQAGLDDEQRVEFQRTTQRQFGERVQQQRRRRQLIRALDEQLRPGVAANPDSVTALLESLVVVGEDMAAAVRTHQDEYAAFLTAVQRGLFVIHYERFQRQIEAVQRRQMPRRGNRPGGSVN